MYILSLYCNSLFGLLALSLLHVDSKITIFTSAVLPNDCSWSTKDNAPEVYWINLDRSKTRKKDMERHLDEVGFRHFRIRGLTPQEIFMPQDIEDTWKTARCKLETDWKPPNKLDPSFMYNISEWNQYTAYMGTLCGRGKKKNTPKELGCTTSHLFAMRKAIYSTTAKSRYALIVEDDVLFPFDIDFDVLAKSAPAGFGILQLFNSNDASMERSWNSYVRDATHLWIARHPVKFDFWSTCAYLIDRVVMKSVIDAIVSEQEAWTRFNVIAGINSPCVPKECCMGPGNVFQSIPPCVFAPRGYQADSFLYAMTSTYVTSIPVIANGLGGNQSTFHQDHVEMLHRRAFRRQREYVNKLYKEIKPPSFLRAACSSALDVNAI